MSKLSELAKKIRQLFQIRRTFFRGLLITLPLGIIVWIIYGILNAFNTLGDEISSPFLPRGYQVWGMGLLIVLILIFVIGRLEIYAQGKRRNIWLTFKKHTVGRIPLFGTFFVGSDKNVMSWDELLKMTPCKFWLSATTSHYGFIIRKQKVKGAETEIDIYRPNVPTIVPGDLFPMKKRLVIKLGNPSGQILEKLASGGFVGADEEIPLPWEDETDEEFQERINLTPLEIAVKRVIEDRLLGLS